ncbi:MAG: hypothetical protein AB7N76_33635 [Planctomycetota bacterium]
MVDKGQLLERPVVIPVEGRCLDGIYLRGRETPLLIASPLPHRGGSMASSVGNELAYAAARAGCGSLRLDYSGVGASEGEQPATIEAAAADLGHGLDFLLESTGRRQAALAGWLSGCFAALALARRDPRVDRLLLVAPPWEEEAQALADQGLEASYLGLERPVLVVLPLDDPGYHGGAERQRVESCLGVRLELLPGERGFREALTPLARLVPPFLGVAGEARGDEERAREQEGFVPEARLRLGRQSPPIRGRGPEDDPGRRPPRRIF